MGLDLVIRIRAKSITDLDGRLLCGQFVPEAVSEDWNYTLVNTLRYWHPEYQRGDWPLIAHDLLELFASADVETIYYTNNLSDYPESSEPFTFDTFIEFCREFSNPLTEDL